MKMDSEQVLDSIFLSYNKILKRFQLLGVTTKYGKEITHKDLRKAIEVMLKKHPTCRWRSEKVKSRKYFILAEGYVWLTQVYFQKEKSLIDADVDFFEDRIRQYEELLKVENLSIGFNVYVKGLRQNYLHVISDLSLDVKKSEIVAVLGSSGSGKSLLADSILGILPSNAVLNGDIYYKNKKITISSDLIFKNWQD